MFVHFDDACEEDLSKFGDEEQDKPGRKDGGILKRSDLRDGTEITRGGQIC